MRGRLSFAITAFVLIFGAVATMSCSGGGDGEETADSYILYRTDSNSPRARFHFATFNGARDAVRNKQDCETTAVVMNANMHAFGMEVGQVERYGSIHFWCEKGPFTIEGKNPSERGEEYDAQFPYNPRGQAGRLGN